MERQVVDLEQLRVVVLDPDLDDESTTKSVSDFLIYSDFLGELYFDLYLWSKLLWFISPFEFIYLFIYSFIYLFIVCIYLYLYTTNFDLFINVFVFLLCV